MRRPIKEIKNPKQRKLATNFKNNLTAMRNNLGLRQSDIADKCNLSLKYVADIEQGNSGNPTIETICEIARGLGLKDPLELLKGNKS